MAYSQAWLEDASSIRGILIEATVKDVVANTETTKYLSNIGYVVTDGTVSYLPIISGGVQVTETLPLDGSATLSFGDIELDNLSGELDDWLDSSKYIWVNRSIKAYIGDPRWLCANLSEVYTKFEKIFDGVIADIDSKTRTKLNIKIRDKLERLNTPITETVIGTYGNWASGQSNTDQLKPVVIGEVHNITPVLIDPSQLEYMVNRSSVESIIEIRDNGVPLYSSGTATTSGATVDLPAGKFKLNQAVAGTITASVQGTLGSFNFSTGSYTATYNNNVANLVALLAVNFGSSPLSVAELDLPNLLNFSNANTQPVGLYTDTGTSVISACQEIASSIGAQIYISRKGQLQLLRIGENTSDAVVTITEDDILYQTLAILNRTEVVCTNKIAYCKNWTTQSNLTTAIYPEDKELFSTEYLPAKSTTDTAVKGVYRLSEDVPEKNTLLLKGTDAKAEANRLTNFYKVPRSVYKFTGTSKLLSLKLGQGVILTHSRFGLSQGKPGQVVSLSPDWLTSLVEVEVLI